MPGGRRAPSARARSRPSWAASMPPCQPSPVTPESGVYIRVLPAGGKGDVRAPLLSHDLQHGSAALLQRRPSDGSWPLPRPPHGGEGTPPVHPLEVGPSESSCLGPTLPETQTVQHEPEEFGKITAHLHKHPLDRTGRSPVASTGPREADQRSASRSSRPGDAKPRTGGSRGSSPWANRWRARRSRPKVGE